MRLWSKILFFGIFFGAPIVFANENEDAYPSYDRAECVAPSQIWVDSLIEVDSDFEPKHFRNQGETNSCYAFSAQFLAQYHLNQTLNNTSSSPQIPSVVGLIGRYKSEDLTHPGRGITAIVFRKIQNADYRVALDTIENGKGDFERIYGPDLTLAQDWPFSQWLNSKHLNDLQDWIFQAMPSSMREKIQGNSSIKEEYLQFLRNEWSNSEASFVNRALFENRFRDHAILPPFNILRSDTADSTEMVWQQAEAMLKNHLSPLELDYFIHATVVTGVRRVCCGDPISKQGNCHFEAKIRDSIPEKESAEGWYLSDQTLIGHLTQIVPCNPGNLDPSLPKCYHEIQGIDEDPFLRALDSDEVEAVKAQFSNQAIARSQKIEWFQRAVQVGSLKILEWASSQLNLTSVEWKQAQDLAQENNRVSGEFLRKHSVYQQ